jgi:hypothetical protein
VVSDANCNTIRNLSFEQGKTFGNTATAVCTKRRLWIRLGKYGYYKVLNDNWDVTFRGNLYSYGGWSLNVSPEYYKRYKYRGALTLSLQKNKIA